MEIVQFFFFEFLIDNFFAGVLKNVLNPGIRKKSCYTLILGETGSSSIFIDSVELLLVRDTKWWNINRLKKNVVTYFSVISRTPR